MRSFIEVVFKGIKHPGTIFEGRLELNGFSHLGSALPAIYEYFSEHAITLTEITSAKLVTGQQPVERDE